MGGTCNCSGPHLPEINNNSMKSPSCGGKKWKLQGTGEHDATCQHQRDILEFFGQFYSPSPLQGSSLSAKKGQEVPLPRVKQAKNYCYQAIVPVLEPPHRNQGRTKQSIPCFVWITVPQKGLDAKPKESLSPKQQHFFGNRVPFTPWPWEGKCRCVCGAAQASTGTLLLSCPATVPGSSSSSSHPGQLCCRGAQGWGSGLGLRTHLPTAAMPACPDCPPRSLPRVSGWFCSSC